MVILNSFFDESGKFKDHKVVSFCGVCATPSKLHIFDEEWRELLRRFDLPYLTMKRALANHRALSPKIPKQSADDRAEALKPFSSCLRNNLEVGVVIQIDVQGYAALSPKARKSIGNANDPYYLAFIRSLTELTAYAHGEINVSFICDDGEDTALPCYKFYRQIRKLNPIWRDRLVSLSFADDKKFPGLQAADMLASLARLEARRRFYREHHDYRGLVNHLLADSVPTSIQWLHLSLGKSELQSLSNALDKLKQR